MAKTAHDTKEAWSLSKKYDGEPHGWLQWKGTDVCMDIHCVCGCDSHVHGDFCYHVKCPKCGRIYFCNGHIEFIEVETHNEDEGTLFGEE